MSVLKDWSNMEVGDEKTRKEFDSMMGDYETMIRKAGYQLPEAAPYFIKTLPKDAEILDLCCGTGLVGEALIAQGWTNITGVDFSLNSQLAKEKGYKKVIMLNLNNITSCGEPFPFYDVVFMVGSLTYFKDKEIIRKINDCIDFNRFIFSHRIDLVTPEFEDFLEEEFEDVHIIRNIKYLPFSEHYHGIDVNWYTVTK